MNLHHALAGLKAWHAFAALLVLGAVCVAGAWYGHRELVRLEGAVAELHGELASTTIGIEADIAKTNSALGDSLEAQGAHVDAVTHQVASLEKLQALDPQLLAKYSKVYFLNENYIPAGLAEVPKSYSYFDDKQMQLLPQILPHLEAMLTAASSSAAALYVYSAYRSFDTQSVLKQQYKVTFGAGTAGSFSADQGYSEHQLGTAVDLITTGLGGQLDQAFAKTPAYAWLVGNAYRYGFTLSYPPGNSYYIYEPWHWRYVGVALATDLHKEGKYFYDLDQRTIDTYLADIFD